GEAERDRGTAGGGRVGKRNREGEEAGLEGRERGDERAVDAAFEGGWGEFETAGVGVRAKLAVKRELGEAGAGRELKAGGFAEPDGVGGKLVEEQAGETGGTPRGGAGRSGAGRRHRERRERKGGRLPWQSFMRRLRCGDGDRGISADGGGGGYDV